MAKYTLELNEVQAQTVSQACEFFARIKMGQFDARKAIYPELNGIGHSYGVGKFADADRAFDVYQVLRHALGDPREPFQLGEPLPSCTKLE